MIKSEIFASVLRDVCEVTGISERDIMSKSKSEEIVDARHLLVVTLRRSGYYPGMIAESRDAMVAEVENMMRTSKEVLESVDYHRNALEACESIMCSLNPRLAEEKEQKEKIETLERKLGGIEDTVGDLKELLLKALKSSKS